MSPGPPAFPTWLEELPLRPGPPWVAMDIRTLDWTTWLVADDERDRELALRAALLRDRRDEVLQINPVADAAAVESAALVDDWLARHTTPAAPTTSSASPPLDQHPLEAAARRVQEDLCVMVPIDGAYRLEAAVVCFASHWRLADKMGAPLSAIHGPVPHYADQLARRVDTFFDRLRVERPVVRRNLSIHDHDDLLRPEPSETFEDFDGDLDRVWLRSERQTLVRLPSTGAVLFTIKTQQCPVTMLARVPLIAHGLAAKLRALGADLERNGLAVHFPAVLPDWLDAT